jgi:UDPglucose 6-dehydrogenase
LVTGACLASQGHRVVCFDTNQEKIATLKAGGLPIYEQGLDKLVQQGLEMDTLLFTTDLDQAIHFSDRIFIAVGTPATFEGQADLTYVHQAIKRITSVGQGHKWIFMKSTVPVGTCQILQRTYSSDLKNRDGFSFELISNPEFLRQGHAVQDFLFPDRIIVGTQSEVAYAIAKAIYQTIDAPLLKVNLQTAEMTKYAANAFLATKISYINMLADLCEKVEADIDEVATGMGLDNRIGTAFLQAGIGFGGSCFPKDMSALLSLAEENGVGLPIIDAALAINQHRPYHLVQCFKEVMVNNVQGLHVTCWGVTFKAVTGDIRKSPALQVIELLVELGCHVTVYDPMIKNVRHPVMGRVTIETKLYHSIEMKDALFILTDWNLFKEVSWFYVQQQMRRPNIFDGRNLLQFARLAEIGINYYPIGKEPQQGYSGSSSIFSVS